MLDILQQKNPSDQRKKKYLELFEIKCIKELEENSRY
jgi:hypothetical protein